jgi:hypothetical protein
MHLPPGFNLIGGIRCGAKKYLLCNDDLVC